MSIHPLIPMIKHFLKLTLKIQGQGHSSRSQSGYNTLSTHIPFVSCRLALPFLGYSYFKIWHWKFKVKVMVGSKLKSQHGSNIQSTHIPFVPCQSDIPFLSYISHFMGEVTVQSHNVGLTSYRLTSLSFHVNRPSHSWDTAFSFVALKIQGQGQMTMMLLNYMSWQFHRASNGINPSGGFRDMGSAKSGPSAAWFDKFLAHGQAHMGKWANNWRFTTTGLDKSMTL